MPTDECDDDDEQLARRLDDAVGRRRRPGEPFDFTPNGWLGDFGPVLLKALGRLYALEDALKRCPTVAAELAAAMAQGDQAGREAIILGAELEGLPWGDGK